MAEIDIIKADEIDPYVAQLRGIFESCDKSGSGILGQHDLRELCRKLQLEAETENLIHHLLGSDLESKVDFPGFQVGIVHFLSSTMIDLNPVNLNPAPMKTDQTLSDTRASFQKSSDLFARGRKRQHKKPQRKLERSLEFSDSFPDSLSPRLNISDSIANDSEIPMKRIDRKNSETFEAEGESNLNMTGEDTFPPLTGEEEHVREVWRTLGMDITKDITISDLGRVCEHIGMDMSDEEMKQLFGRLDGDGDGRITFDEFHQGLFQHGLSANQPISSNTSLPLTPLPHTPQSRRRSRGLTPVRSHDDSLRALTPSGNPALAGSGIFSSIDHNKTGFCSIDDLLENWESIGVLDGENILSGLGFSSQSKISLPELSFLLTQEIAGSADQNSIFQAAFLSYQQELQHARWLVEQTTAEKNKFRQDLASANSRNEMLVKEADERQTRLEQSTESKMLNIEQKYQEQIKVLQGLLEDEREMHINQSVRMKQKLEDKIEGLKHEEVRLKENLIRSQKENEKLERDVNDLMDQLDENETLNNQLRRDLQAANDLHQSYLDGQYPDDSKGFSQSKIQQLHSENKVLTDKIDELTAEVERLKQDLLTVRRTSFHGGQLSTSPTSSPGNKRRRQHSTEYLTSEETIDEGPIAMSPDELAKSEAKLLELVQELELMKKNSEEERKDVEQIFKMEIVEIEERHDQEKEQLIQSFSKEKERLREELQSTHQDALAEQDRKLQNEFAAAKQDLILKYESEKNYMEHKFSEEKSVLEERLENSLKTDNLKNQSPTERNSNVVKNVDFSKEKAVLLDRFLKEKRDLEELNAQEKAEIFKDVESERKELVQQYKGEITELKDQITSLRERLEIANDQVAENQSKLKEANIKLQLQEAELTKKLTGKLTQELKDKLTKELREKLTQEVIEETEEVFVAQIQEIRKAHEADRKTLEDSRKLLQDEINTMKLNCDKLKDEMTELKKFSKQMQFERDNLKSQLESSRNHLRTLEESHNSKLAEISSQKQEVLMVQSKAESLESSNRAEKALYLAANVDKKYLESTVKHLQEQTARLQSENANLKLVEEKYNEIVKDKEGLEGRVRLAELSMQELMESQKNLLKAQSTTDDLLKRITGLEVELMKKDKLLSTLQTEKQHMVEELNVTQEKSTTDDLLKRITGLEVELMKKDKLLSTLQTEKQQRVEEFNVTQEKSTTDELLKRMTGLEVELMKKDKLLSTLQTEKQQRVEELNVTQEKSEKLIRSNILLKQLDLKNKMLSEALFLTEARQKKAEANYYSMAERCKAFQDMAFRVARAGISR